MLRTKKVFWSVLALLMILSLVLAACRPAATPTEAPPPTQPPAATDPSAPSMPEVDFAVLPGGFLEQAINGDFAGTEVTVDGPFTNPDDLRFFESVEAFEEATGITVNYIGDKEFEARLAIAVDAGNPPDIADFPQPGKAGNFARQGHIVDPTSWMPESWLQQQYNPSWLDMGMVEGPDGGAMNAGVWHRFNGKSLVWYPKDDFDAAGYEIPTTWQELLDLSQLIADDGDSAWCIGIESGAATGWAATDWTEEMMLRTTSLSNYDAWVAGTLPFASPEVKTAIETWSEVWFNPDYVFGGTDTIVSTNFGDSPAPMFEDPPKCWMHKQGNFITGFFPDGAQAGVDYDFFYLPPVDEAYGKPFLVAGDIMSMFNDRPEVRALMEYFTTPQSAAGWLQNGGALAAHLTATPDLYGVDLERGIAELVAEATSFRFDASDLMPGEVGAGSFWTGMTDYVSGLSDLDTALDEIDASWPAGVTGAGPAGIGTADNPIKVLFVPSVDTQAIVSGGEVMADALNAATGLEFEVVVPTSYAATIEEMCASPDNSMGFIPGLGYVLANQLCGVDVAFKAVRFGSSVYWAQFVVQRDSDIQTMEDLDGLKWAYPDAGSTSGYMVPLVTFDEMGITPGETLEAGGHTGTIRAVYNEEADFGTTFFSAPLRPADVGPWVEGDFPDIPDDVLASCGPDADGARVYCGEDADGDGTLDWRVLDARAGLREEAPDVIQKLRILSVSAAIPNDTLSFGPEFPEDLRQQIADALFAFSETEAWADSIGNPDFYDWTGIQPAADEEYDFVRLMVEAVGLTLEGLGE